ncbi:MAG: MFS transporter [Actinobacteria bacterium]|nr:MFS transporter [Actinomycetota bacterium]
MPFAVRAPASALVAVLLVRLADESAAFLPSGTLESFRTDLGLSYTQAGAVLSAIAPGALVGAGFAAAADHYSRRVIAAGGALSFAVSLAAFGLLMGPALVGGVAFAGLSWRVAFLIGAAAMALYALALSAVPLPAPPAAPEEADGARSPARSKLRAVLRDPVVWVLGLIGLLMNPFDEPLVGFTIALLEQERGASSAAATLVAFVGVSGGVLTFTVLARRFEDTSDARLLLGAAVTMTVGTLAIATVPIIAVVALASFVASVGLNLAWLAVQHRSLTARPGEVGTTNAVLSAVEFSGFWIPAAIGAVADGLGLVPAVASYALLGALLIGLARSQLGAGRDRERSNRSD